MTPGWARSMTISTCSTRPTTAGEWGRAAARDLIRSRIRKITELHARPYLHQQVPDHR